MSRVAATATRASRTAALPLVVGALVLAVLALRGGGDGYVVYAKFKDAGGILKNYNVKIGQVKAGTVKAITLDRADNAVVKMVLNKEAAPIGPGAVANVRPVNLLGERYIDLNPGDLSKPLPSGSTIQTARTSAPVELDDVLNMLDPDTRGALRIVINEAGLALAGRGADFNSVLEDLPPALDEARRLLGEVAAQNAALDRLAVTGDRVLAATAAKHDDLTRLVRSAADALGTVAQRRERLGATIRSAPAGLASLRGTLGELQEAARRLRPAAADLRAAEPALARTLERLPRFARDAHGTLVTAAAVAPALRRLGRDSTPTLRRLRPTAARLATFAGDLRPLVDAADRGKGLNEFLGFMNAWESVTGGKDGLGHFFRLRATVDKELVESAVRRYAGGPAGARRRRSARRGPTRPGVLQRPSPARDSAPPEVRLPKLRLPGAIKPVLDTVTGLPAVGQVPGPDGVRELLDYLLGP